jgi:hypothetical protein
MKTDALIDLLATGPVEVRGRLVTRRFGLALAAGGLLVFVEMVAWLGVRPDLGEVMATPAMWIKLAFVLAATAGALWVSVRLARPGLKPGAAWVALLAPFLLIWALAGAQMSMAPPGERLDLFFGLTWAECPWCIAILSMPAFALSIWAMRGLAPTRLRLAGASAGLLSGTLAASIYTLHCPEMSAPFVGFWYVLGMLIPTAVGALIGPRLLRW